MFLAIQESQNLWLCCVRVLTPEAIALTCHLPQEYIVEALGTCVWPWLACKN